MWPFTKRPSSTVKHSVKATLETRVAELESKYSNMLIMMGAAPKALQQLKREISENTAVLDGRVSRLESKFVKSPR